MFIIYSTRLYGKCDHAPGLFYVATTFFHVNWIPLIPVGSYLIMDDGAGENGVPVTLSPLSVLLGWARAAGFVAGPIMMIVAGADKQVDPSSRMTLGFGGLLLLVLTIASYWVFCIGRDRAVRRAERAGLNPNFVHDHFDRQEGKPPAPRLHGGQLEGRQLDEALRRWNPNQPPEN